ncbi:MAG: hypothetical protein AAFW87_01890 [Pseudomonadota bacterium]
MPTDSMTKLERDADAHRAGLADAMGQLIHAFNPQRLGEEAVEHAAQTGRTAASVAVKAAKDNPAGLALIGIGAALLMTNRRNQTAPQTAVSPLDAMQGQTDRIAKAEDRIRNRAQIKNNSAASKPAASSMRRMLDHGLDKLGPGARNRVIAMRLKAIDAQETIERHARNARKVAVEAHQTQPFVTGLAIAGVGALIGALLPSSRREAELMGAKRDQLFRAAESALREELSALETRGKAAVQAAVEKGTSEFNDKTAAA